MEQVSGPVVAVGLVLSAVFVPCAFITGIMGQFFQQFAVTIAVSTAISCFNSLTLSPALAALLLRPRRKGVYEALPRWAFAVIGGWTGYQLLGPRLAFWLDPALERLAGTLLKPTDLANVAFEVSAVLGALMGWVFGRPLNTLLGVSFRLFNQGFDYSTGLYARMVGRLLRASVLVLLVYGGLLFLTWWSFTRTPTGFIPAQDKGYLLVNLQLPDAASVQRTEKVMERIDALVQDWKGIKHRVAVSGQSLLLNLDAPNFGSMFLMLDDFHKRTEAGLSADAIAARLQQELDEQVPEADVQLFGAPPIEGLGTAGGFKIMIQDPRSAGLDVLQAAADQVVARGNTTPGLQGLYTSFRAKTPWLYIDIDRAQAKVMGVSMAEVFNTLQVYLGSLYVNDLTLFGRTWQVNVQADRAFRGEAKDLNLLQVRNERGQMVPLGSVARVRGLSGPVLLMRYNMYPAAAINGNPGPGMSSGPAIQLMKEVVEKEVESVDPTLRHEWTELALMQLQTGQTAMMVFVLAVVLVFLVLAAQYESWSLPLAVILVVPLCLLFSITGVALAQMDINVFTQVGFVVLVGLACKNAILIVEFARARRKRGTPRYEATLEACQLRLRPIMMTSLAFILGVVPLMISRGAGAEMRQTLGTAVFAGMLGVTLFGIFLTPVFFYVIQWWTDRRPKREAETEESEELPLAAAQEPEMVHMGYGSGHKTSPFPGKPPT
jgi:hydrophobe/amphiphile efflux-1 (HAE1) family protein